MSKKNILNFFNYFIVGFIITSIKVIIDPVNIVFTTLFYTYINNLIIAIIAGFGAAAGIAFFSFLNKKK